MKEASKLNGKQRIPFDRPSGYRLAFLTPATPAIIGAICRNLLVSPRYLSLVLSHAIFLSGFCVLSPFTVARQKQGRKSGNVGENRDNNSVPEKFNLHIISYLLFVVCLFFDYLSFVVSRLSSVTCRFVICHLSFVICDL